MSHITKINGTNHNINSGKVLRSGTSYSINSGKTLISGTSKSISFLPIKDLTDTYWMWSDHNSVESGFGNYNITFNVYNRTDRTFYTLNIPFNKIDHSSFAYIICHSYGDYYIHEATTTLYYGYIEGSSNGWGFYDISATQVQIDNNYKYFHILSGYDVTNTDVIRYLLEHAVQCNSKWNPL